MLFSPLVLRGSFAVLVFEGEKKKIKLKKLKMHEAKGGATVSGRFLLSS
jgi:hypothetical protein